MRDGTATRERIERAARRLFVERGVNETSIRDVANAAGISQGAMYNHYTSKDELARKLFAEAYAEYGNELRRIAGERRRFRDRLRDMIAYIFERFDDDPLRVSYVFFARHLHLRRIDPRRGSPYVAFRNMIEEAMQTGELPTQDLDLATSLLLGAIVQVIDSRIVGPVKGELSRHTDTVTTAGLRLLNS